MPNDDKKPDDKNSDEGGKPDLAKEMETLKASNAELNKRIAELTKKPDPKDDDLNEKARKQREDDDRKSGDIKSMERALRFSLKSEDWLKTNQSLLPKTVGDLFKAADKENYGSAIEKEAAIKTGIIQEFFSIQSNVDLLTQGLKTSLDDYLKLTKTGKQEKAISVFDTVFEPTFEMFKRIKKAEVLNKGYGETDDFEDAYKNKMIKLSKQIHLGEK